MQYLCFCMVSGDPCEGAGSSWVVRPAGLEDKNMYAHVCAHWLLYQDFLKSFVLGMPEGVLCITALLHACSAGFGGVGL